MNIFFLHNEPALAAQAHCDKHVVKMILESAQLLSGVWHHYQQVPSGVLPSNFPDHVYVTDPATEVDQEPVYSPKLLAPTHLNHPCAIWAKDCAENYYWLAELAVNLCDEYTYRYGKQHALTELIRLLRRAAPYCMQRSSAGITVPALAMPSSTKKTSSRLFPADLTASKILEDLDTSGYAYTIYAYRIYYLTSKSQMLTYTRRQPPAWAAKLATWKQLKQS